MEDEKLIMDQIDAEVHQAFEACNEVLTGTNVGIVMGACSLIMQSCILSLAGDNDLIDESIDVHKKEIDAAACVVKSGIAPPSTTTH